MGLITGLLTLPLAPVRGVAWVARRVGDAAEAELYDPAAIRAELADLYQDLEDGLIDEATYDEREEELLDRLEYAAGAVGGGNPGAGPGGFGAAVGDDAYASGPGTPGAESGMNPRSGIGGDHGGDIGGHHGGEEEP
jgi:hypothetical protein